MEHKTVAEEELFPCSLRTREEWLREEIRQHRVLSLSLLQWGMGLETVFGSALYFIRQAVAQGMKNSQYVIPAQVLSRAHWFVGTFILALLALAFSLLTANLFSRHFYYRKQLENIANQYSKIDDGPIRKGYQWIPLAFFWIFPVLDSLAWLLYHK